MKRSTTYTLLFTFFVGLLLPGLALSENREETLQRISRLRAGERENVIREGARKEASLVWYSSTSTDNSLALIRKFRQAHPFVDVRHLRSPSEKMMERIVLESRAGNLPADVVALPQIELDILAKKKLILKYAGVEQNAYPDTLKDPRGFWTGIYLTAWVTAYNTKLVSPQTAPKRFADLLEPKWKGEIGMDVEPYSWFASSLRYLESRLGEAGALEYFRKLARQEIQWRKGHTLIAQLVAAGEFPLAAELQVHTLERLKANGVPIEWAALDGVIPVNAVGISIAAGGAHPYASMLFYEFLLSRAGMETLRDQHAIPTRPDVPVPYLKPYRLLPLDPQAVDRLDRYISLFREILKPRS